VVKKKMQYDPAGGYGIGVVVCMKICLQDEEQHICGSYSSIKLRNKKKTNSRFKTSKASTGLLNIPLALADATILGR